MCCYTEKEAKAADVLKSILKAGLFLGIMFAVMTLAGCSSLQNLADKRSSQGCYVSGAKVEIPYSLLFTLTLTTNIFTVKSIRAI